MLVALFALSLRRSLAAVVRLCSCSLLNSQSVFLRLRPLQCPPSHRCASLFYFHRRSNGVPFVPPLHWSAALDATSDQSGLRPWARIRGVWRLCEPPSAMQEGTSPSLSSPDRDLASVYLARSRTAVPIRDFDPIAAQVRQCLACPPSAPCQLNALQQPPCSHIECRSISRHRPEAPLRGPRSLQTTTQPRQLHPHHRSVRS